MIPTDCQDHVTGFLYSPGYDCYFSLVDLHSYHPKIKQIYDGICRPNDTINFAYGNNEYLQKAFYCSSEIQMLTFSKYNASVYHLVDPNPKVSPFSNDIIFQKNQELYYIVVGSKFIVRPSDVQMRFCLYHNVSCTSELDCYLESLHQQIRIHFLLQVPIAKMNSPGMRWYFTPTNHLVGARNQTVFIDFVIGTFLLVIIWLLCN